LKLVWSRPLNLRTKKGIHLERLSDLRDYMLSLDDRTQKLQHWQHAAKLALEAAETGKMDDLKRQLMLAFLLHGEIVLD